MKKENEQHINVKTFFCFGLFDSGFASLGFAFICRRYGVISFAISTRNRVEDTRPDSEMLTFN